MNAGARTKLAAERAAGYAPMPTNSGPVAGMVGTTLAGILLIAVSRFYSVDLMNLPGAVMVVAVLAAGFAFPAAFSIRRRRQHERATSVELQRIDEQTSR